jgi:hypothetical protein
MSIGLTHWEKKADGARSREALAIESPLLSIAEAVAYLRLGQSTIYERLHQFEVVRLGRRLFITRASADNYIKANLRPATRPVTRSRRARRGCEQHTGRAQHALEKSAAGADDE